MPKQTLFVVTEELRQTLERLPAAAPKSQLDPLRPFIMRWRRDGRTYRDIRRILREECKVVVCCETIRKFVQTRSRPRKPKPEPETDQLELAVAEAPAALPPASAFAPGAKRLTPEERQGQVEHIRSLNQPTPQSQPEKPRWHFDVDKPRTLHKP